MNGLINRIEAMKPFFEKISNNAYLRAIRDGFISCIPVILFSSVFLLIAYVPNIFGFYWSAEVEAVLMKAYNYSMGILAILMSATIAKSLTDNFNNKLPATRKINVTSAMIVSIIAFLLLSADSIEGGLASGYLGSKGLLASFVAAFVTPVIYRFFVSRDIRIKMPKEVPNNISQTFADLFPLATTIFVFWIVDFLFRTFIGFGFAEWVIELFKPIFTAADGYLGISLIYGAMAFFWFVGIHGPSIVEPAVSAIYITNVEMNLLASQQGLHAGNVLSQGTQYFVATLGGTGATLIITLMFAFLAKSKQLKAVGTSSAVPVLFGVNEPVLFGAPLVLNPVFFIPFICAPIVNVCLFKLFVDLGMNGFIYNLPWTCPGTLGLIMGTGFAPLAIVLAILLLVVDFVIYYPFFKVYDKDCCEKEAAGEVAEDEKITSSAAVLEAAKKSSKKAVLVLCANGATSSMLANAIATGAKEAGLDLESTAMAYGQHKSIINDFDLIILAPQMGSMFDELKEDVSSTKCKAATTQGPQYVKLTRNPEEALNFALNLMDGE
ncbi:MAG: PTS transporter subunit EIIC [Bacillota bacterium]|nr:PTS transporter subunit EIIC [Bacillota bacterium]